MAPLSVPSVYAIRLALEEIKGAIRTEPSAEDAAAGTGLGTPVLHLGWEKFDRIGGLIPPDADETKAASEQPDVIFEVPPKLTDADVFEALGEGAGELKRLVQIKGADALGWYLTFHQRAAQHGIYLPIEGIATLAVGALGQLALPIERRLEIAFHAILRHELFHFEADCMAANWELALGRRVYWRAKDESGDLPGYKGLEEALANAYMLRGLRHPGGALRNSRGSYDALKAFCELQPPGYRDGPLYATSRAQYADGCRTLSVKATSAGEWVVPAQALDTLIFYPNPFQIDWSRCPILVHDRLGILKTLGIGLDFFEKITGVVESLSFLRDLRRHGRDLEGKWSRRKERFALSVGREAERWRPGGPNCYSVRIDDNFRAHLSRDAANGSWTAESIGDHKSMGHG
jgi:hypothetical protein